MALVSPGVQVTVTDQSNYAPTALGSVAYILLATAQDKVAPGGTAIAAGTLQENAGKIYTITSQRDLVTTFGTPIFKTTSSGAPINAAEQNEYGLLAAYSALGVSNTMYVQRANVDLGALTGTTIRPLSNPGNGTFWLDTSLTNWGIYEWNAGTQNFEQQPVTVINSDTLLVNSFTPVTSVGAIGDYAVNVVDDTNPIFYKGPDNKWNLVGNTAWQASIPVITGATANPVVTTNGNISINGTTVNVFVGNTVTQVNSAIATANITGIYTTVSNGRLLLAGDSTATNGFVNIADVTGNTLTTFGITAGSYRVPSTQASPYFNIPTWQGNVATGAGYPTGSVWQKASQLGSGLNAVLKQFNGVTSAWATQTVPAYANVFAATYGLDPTGGGTNIVQGVTFAQYDAYETSISTLGTYFWYRQSTGPTVVTANTVGASNTINVNDSFTIKTFSNVSTGATATYTVTISTATQDGFVSAVSAADIPYVTAEINSDGALVLTHALGGDMQVNDVSGVLANVGFNTTVDNYYPTPAGTADVYIASNWQPLSSVGNGYYSQASQPFEAPVNDKYWYYNTPARADIMISNGSAWVGYRTLSSDIRGYNLSATNQSGPILSATAPTTQDNGAALVLGDLWLDTSDLENYPKVYRYQNVSGINQWVLINNSDNTSQNGIIFADARWATSGSVDPVLDPIPTIASLATSSYVDLDAPDPAFYPRGILLFNTRASGYNVKQYKSEYFTAQAYPTVSGAILANTNPATWVTVSGFDTSGIPNFGRKAQRGVVVAALKSAIDSSTALREDQNIFNLIACPGYPELIPNMIALNEDRGQTGFIIGDTPMRLAATGTDIQAWAQNSTGSTTTSEDGLTTINPYVGVYYPSGQTNDLSGAPVVVPPSHAVIRSIIKSDNISYPWLAPAGTRRGLIDNLNAIGYVDSTTGQFISIGVTQGLRDVMYTNKINPLTNLPGTGLVVYGQKTLSSTPSAMDRINVARLVNYLRLQLNTLTRPFIFEPNDPITRKGVTAIVSSLLNDLIAKRGITDYLVVCDTTNNTPERIARNELFVDVAVQPTKAVEFIYIPIRLKNPGEIQADNLAPAATVGTGA